jgi:flagellar motor switch protein FliN/FliY
VADPNWPRDLRGRLSRLGKAGLEVTVELGRTRLPLEQVVNLEPGSLVELEKLSGQPVDVRVNGTLFGKGEIVVVGEQMAVRMTELLRPEEMK